MGNENQKMMSVFLQEAQLPQQLARDVLAQMFGIINPKELAVLEPQHWEQMKKELAPDHYERLSQAVTVQIFLEGLQLERYTDFFYQEMGIVKIEEFKLLQLEDWEKIKRTLTGPAMHRLSASLTKRGLLHPGKASGNVCQGDVSMASDLASKGTTEFVDVQKTEANENKDFLQKIFAESDFLKLVEGKKKILVLGMGGGCDVFMAYTFAKKLNGGTDTGNILYANCITEERIPPDHIVLVENALYAVPPGEPHPLVDQTGTVDYTEFLASTVEAMGNIEAEKLEEVFGQLNTDNSGCVTVQNLKEILGDDAEKAEHINGTTYLEQSLPRGADNSPLLIELRRDKEDKSDETGQELTRDNSNRIKLAFDYLQVDMAIGIDCGGKGLTGGKTHSLTGLEQQVLYAFRKYREMQPGFDFCHVVLAPGCDAETTEDILVQEVWRTPTKNDTYMQWCTGRMFLGSFSINQLILDCFPLVQELAPNRAPYLMYRALKDDEEFNLERPQPSDAGYESENKRDLVKLQRHGHYQLIPRNWLLNGLVFSYESSEDSFMR